MLGFASLHRDSHFRGSPAEGAFAGFEVWQWIGQAGVDDFLISGKGWAGSAYWPVGLDLHC